MSFIKRVRDSKVKRPTGHGFDLQAWSDAFNTLSSGEDEFNLFYAGTWTFIRLETIRAMLRETDKQLPPRDQLFKLLTGMLNRECKLVTQKGADAMERLARTQGAARDTDVLQLRERDIMGNPTDMDGAITIIVDGARFAFSHAAGISNTESEAADGDAFMACRRLIGFGQMYDQTHNFWEDCLWNGWSIKEGKPFDTIGPGAESPHLELTVTYYRWLALRFQILSLAGGLWMHFPDSIRDRYLAMSPVAERSNEMDGDSSRYALRSARKEEPATRVLVNVALEEEYYSIFMDLSLPRLGTLTLRQISTAWSVLQALAEAQQREVPDEFERPDLESVGKFICTAKRTDVIHYIMEWLKTDLATAEQLVGFFTYHGKPREDLWTAPLVEISDDEFALVHLPLLYGSPTYFLERCLRRGGMDMTAKGTLFEGYVRDLLVSSLRSSKLLRRAGLHRGRFDIDRSDVGDVDVVLWIGNTVLMGEAKCVIFPIEPYEIHSYFKTLNDAAEQITRKVDYYRTRAQEVIARLGEEGRINPEELRILPFVITNHSIGVGYPIREVPIVDFPILERFILDGTLHGFATPDESGMLVPQRTRVLYSSEDEAEKILLSYLLNPPQVSNYARHVVPTVRTLMGLTKHSRYAAIAGLEVNIPPSAWPAEVTDRHS
jgi:hypothetical protein